MREPTRHHFASEYSRWRGRFPSGGEVEAHELLCRSRALAWKAASKAGAPDPGAPVHRPDRHEPPRESPRAPFRRVSYQIRMIGSLLSAAHASPPWRGYGMHESDSLMIANQIQGLRTEVPGGLAMSFGDIRVARRADWMIERVAAMGTVVLRQLGETRAGEMRVCRFLSSPYVSVVRIVRTLGAL